MDPASGGKRNLFPVDRRRERSTTKKEGRGRRRFPEVALIKAEAKWGLPSRFPPSGELAVDLPKPRFTLLQSKESSFAGGGGWQDGRVGEKPSQPVNLKLEAGVAQ